jgi:L-seryl-tRNA(Ser) seleniumtransferase
VATSKRGAKKAAAVDASVQLRQLPGVDAFLNGAEGAALSAEFGTGAVKWALRQRLGELREDLRDGSAVDVPDVSRLAVELRGRLLRLTLPEGRRAINATGILLHTGLGRAPLAADTVAALGVCGGYSVLQADLETGKRSQRDGTVEAMLRELTGCEAATVVNNNAAATMLMLNAMAAGKEVVLSRGQLIEIGGAFRMPDVMERSGAILREIGTTNRTHLRDYAAAIGEKTGAILHVHTSNYRVRGFSGTPDIQALCELRKATHPDLPVLDDLGSGALVSLAEFGLPDEPLVAASIAAGADVVCFSGDKLIGGPQAGILCGRRKHIERIRKNPFARMFRVDKIILAALETALFQFISGQWRETIPFYRMLARPVGALDADAAALTSSLAGIAGYDITAGEDLAYVGSGSIPDEGVPSRVVRIRPRPGERPSPEVLTLALRQNLPAIFCRIHDGALVFDLRTLLGDDLVTLRKEMPKLLGNSL